MQWIFLAIGVAVGLADDNDGTADQHRLVGEGLMHFPSFVRSLEDIGFHGVISLETGVGDRMPGLPQELKAEGDRWLYHMAKKVADAVCIRG